MSATPIQVIAFSPGWGLPSTGPFACKLLAWMRLTGLPHVLRFEDDTRKGPKGKSPWIEIDGKAMADSDLIIEHLGARFGVSLDAWQDPVTAARALALRRMVEEHLHQVFEYEFIVLDAGYARFRGMVLDKLPPLVGTVVANRLRAHFRSQLRARGIARHAPDEIERMGRADVDALSALLGEQRWFFGDQPCSADCAIWGQLAPMVLAQLPTPVCQHARGKANLAAWVLRVRDELFPEIEARAAA